MSELSAEEEGGLAAWEKEVLRQQSAADEIAFRVHRDWERLSNRAAYVPDYIRRAAREAYRLAYDEGLAAGRQQGYGDGCDDEAAGVRRRPAKPRFIDLDNLRQIER